MTNIDLGHYGLVELPSEERHGFVWAVLTRDHPIDVAAHLGELDDEIGRLGCEKMHYYPSHDEVRIDANWKSVAEGLLEGIHVPIVHAQTFNLNPQAANVDLAYYDGFGPHVRWGLGLFDHDGAKAWRVAPRAEWEPEQAIGNIWLISPGLLLANELYGVIYADAHPRRSSDRILLPLRLAEPGDRSPRRNAKPGGHGGPGPPGGARRPGGVGGLRPRAFDGPAPATS